MNGVAGDMGVLARELGGLFQSRKVLRVYTKPNGSSPPRGSFDEAVALQSLNHIVNCGRGNPEVAFQIRFRGSLATDLSVVVDEGQILTLFGGERWWIRRIELRREIYAYRERIFAKTIEDADFENVYLSPDNSADWLFGGGVEISAQLLCIGAGAFVIRDRDANRSIIGEDPLPAIFVLHRHRLSSE